MKNCFRVLVGCSVVTLLGVSTTSAQAPPNVVQRVELHPIRSVTLSDSQFLKGDEAGGTPVTVAGQLRIPRGEGRVPVVFLIHGSSGVGANIDVWSDQFAEMGVATFVLDGFTGRGLTSVSANQALLGRLNLIVDAYRGLEILAKHPRVDPSRIVLMGFSRGGQATLLLEPQAVRSNVEQVGHTVRRARAFLSRLFDDICRRHRCGSADSHFPWCGGRLHASVDVQGLCGAASQSGKGCSADRVPGCSAHIRQPVGESASSGESDFAERSWLHDPRRADWSAHQRRHEAAICVHRSVRRARSAHRLQPGRGPGRASSRGRVPQIPVQASLETGPLDQAGRRE